LHIAIVWSDLFRLLIAALLGGLIGLEREAKHRPAGLRTNIFICVGAAMYTLLGTAKLNNLDPQAWLADVLERIADQPVHRLHELLPWNWQPSAATPSA